MAIDNNDIFVFENDPIEGEEFQDIPQTGINGFERPVLFSATEDPKEILNLNAGNLRADIMSNSDGNVLYESRAVAKNLTGIAANSTLTEKSTVADSIGGIAAYSNVGFFTSLYHPYENGAFGNSLATNGNGNLIIVGNKTFSSDGYYVGVGTTVGLSTFHGIVYLFERTNSNNFVNRGYIVGKYSKVGYGATHAPGVGTTLQGYGYTLPDYNTPITFVGDDYGHSVAMTADGKTFVVGGPNITGEPTVGIATTTNSRVTIGSTVTIEYPNVGVVWIYDYHVSQSTTFGNFEKIAKFEGEENGDLFGQSVAISADGKIVSIGAPNAGINNEGYAYVYERRDNSYSQVGILTGPTLESSFGDSLSISADGNTIVVGDPVGNKSYVFDRDEDDIDEDNECGIFELVATFNDYGKKVCMCDDGQTIITADTTNSRVYDRLGDSFTLRGTLSGGSQGIFCSSDGKIITTVTSSEYRVYNREGNTFYLNHTGSSTIDAFDMSTNTKTVYRGITSDDKVYCDDQSLETFVYSDVNGNIGIATDAPTERLHVIGNGKFSGTVTAQSFIGDFSASSVNYASTAGIATYATTAGISTTSQGLTGSPNIIVGITTIGLANTSTPPSNSQLSFELTSNTNLRIKVRGTDGVLRLANITLA